MSRPRILLLVPHPDDEVVGCAGAIGRARAAGAHVLAVYLTTGVPAAAWPWTRAALPARVARRQGEARAAAAQLGIEPLRFCPWPARELKSHLAEAAAQIQSLLNTHTPDALWVPAYEGAHQDHDVANFLASRISGQVPVTEFSEYNAWPRPHSHGFPSITGAETTLLLTDAEARTKAALLALYRSERPNLRHLRACRHEVMRPLARHNYRLPAHPPPLFYQRFQWIPFRHPRVDFTSPLDVCSALVRFRQSHTIGN
jgi:LmbE family N-acetylglucosaminyl deacetylase